MMTLDEIAIKENTDKSSKLHNYCKYYEKHLESRRNENLILWEIGVFHGGSIRTWREYFPNATIVGFDVRARYGRYFTQDNKTKFILADATKIETVNDAVKQFGTPDIVIDDGSHHAKDMKASYENIFPILNNNGIYFIEDLCVSGYSQFGSTPEDNMLTYIGTKMIENLNLNKYDASTSDKIKKLQIIKKNNTVFGKPNSVPLDVFEKTIFELHMYTGLTAIVKNVIPE